VGGLTSPGFNTNAVYYASISSGTVGTWESTTNYPTAIEATSCVTSGGYITCVAGLTVPPTGSTPPGTTTIYTSGVYYATVSSSGIGTWTETTDYGCTSSCQSNTSTGMTDSLDTCFVSGGYVVCIGGEYAYGYETADVFSSTLSSGAVGSTWTSTTPYPYTTESGAGGCVAYAGYAYCVNLGGELETDYASVSSGSVGTWTSGPSFPAYDELNQCVVSSGYIYCTGGEVFGPSETGISYYAQISSSTSSTSTSTVVVTSPTTITTTATTISTVVTTSTESTTVTSYSTASVTTTPTVTVTGTETTVTTGSCDPPQLLPIITITSTSYSPTETSTATSISYTTSVTTQTVTSTVGAFTTTTVTAPPVTSTVTGTSSTCTSTTAPTGVPQFTFGSVAIMLFVAALLPIIFVLRRIRQPGISGRTDSPT